MNIGDVFKRGKTELKVVDKGRKVALLLRRGTSCYEQIPIQHIRSCKLYQKIERSV